MTAITRRTCLESMLAATASISLAPAALAQNADDQTVARADTLIATGQPSGGAPTFTQYNDFNPLHPGLDLRSSIAFVLEPLFFYSVLDDKMIPWLAESYEYSEDYTQITVHLRQGVTWNDGTPFGAGRRHQHARHAAQERPGQGRPALRLADGARHQGSGAR